MRSDMDKVITERPRVGGRIKSPKGENKKKNWEKNNEAESKSESIRKKWKASHEEKQFSEKLGPLYRYLLSKVGCPWDEVYSEICKGLSQDSVVQSHVRDHVFDFVTVDCYEENGYIYDAKHPSSPMDGYGKYHSLYVLNGILCKLPHRKRKSWRKEPPKFHVGTQVLKYRDIWYEVELVAFEDPNSKVSLKDMFLGQVSDRWKLHKFYGAYLRCTRKRQLNSKEIEKLT
jgi:hypothetical protein